MKIRWVVASFVAMLLALGLEAQEAKGPIPIEVPKRDKPVDFRADLLPFLKSNCIACHHSKDPEGQLVLETPKTLLKGGESGPAAVPGKSAESLLLLSASHQKKPLMPPRKNKVGAGTLTPQQLGLLKLWIDEGCKESLSVEIEAPHWQPVTNAWHPIYAVGLDSEGQIAACGRAGHLFLYHVPTGRLIDQPSDPKLASLVPPGQPGLADRDAILSLAFSPDGTLLATGGYRSIRIWKRTLPETKSNIDLGGEVKLAALSRDAGTLAIAAGNTVKLLSIAKKGKMAAELKGHGDAVASIRFSPDGASILTGSADKTVRVWKSGDGSPLGRIETPAAVACAEWVADGKQIAAAGADGVIRVWAVPDAATLADGAAKPAALKEWKAAATELRAVASGVLAAAPDGKISLWNLETGKPGREVAHGAPVTSIVVSPDGKRWLSVGGPTATLWNAEDGKKITDLKADGAAARRDRAAQALLAFAGTEVTFRQNAIKALEEAKKKEEAEVKVAADAVAPAEKNAKDKDEAFVKAKQDREAAERAVAEAGLGAETARDRLELALNALAVLDAETALRQAEADTAAVIQYLDESKKHPAMAVDAKLRAESAGRMLQVGRAGVALPRLQAEKAAADQRLADAGAGVAGPKAAADAAAKVLAETKAKAEASKKAVDDAKKKLESVTAEEDKKTAGEALKKLEADQTASAQAAEKAERDAKAAIAAGADAVKKAEDAKTAATAAAAALVQGTAALEAAKKALETAKTAAEAGIKAAEAQKTAALPKKDAAKKAEDAAQNAAEIAKANLESAKGRVEKAKESVVSVDKQVQEATARLEAQKVDLGKAEADRKAAADALTKVKLVLRTAVFSDDGSLVLAGGEDGKIYSFGAERGVEASVFDAHPKALLTIAGGGFSVAVDGTTRSGPWLPTWKLLVDMEPTEPTKPPVDRVLALEFSPDGKILASGGGTPSRDGELLLWSATDGTLLREITGAHSDTVFDLAFTADGSLLASAAADKFARVFDVKTGKLVRSFEGHTNHVLGVAWNRTGRTLATAGADDVIKVWSLESGQQIRTIPGFTKQATALRYVGYDASFAVAAGGVPVRLVQEGGNITRNFDSGGSFMYDLSLSADGQILVAGGLDGVLHLWGTADGKPLATFAPAGPPNPAK
ncbi:MAG TPA: c-type cytochrome domain-containing protein [Planctomycetota bacterium]|nr:c-type cytochrome domain-containing protein [Planctomycetota bacterium]